MAFERFAEECLAKGLLKRQRSGFVAVEKLVLRSQKDLKTAKANLNIDEGIAYTVAYLAMPRAGRALMLLKGFRPADGYQHKTVVEFIAHCLGDGYKNLAERFDRMRRKRNIFTYEIEVTISRTEAEGALATAAKFVEVIRELIKEENPQGHFKF